MDKSSRPVGLGKVENPSLRVVVAELLRNLIVGGQLRPGTPIVEMALAERFKVSRAPVREAMQALEAEGLIENVPYRGTRVRLLTMQDVEELYSLRAQFEAFAVRRVVERGTRIPALGAFVDAMAAAAADGDFDTLLANDIAFHRQVVIAADHALLLIQWDHLSLRIRQIAALRNRANLDLAGIAARHVPIVAALERRDLVRAISLIADHARLASQIDLADLGDHSPRGAPGGSP